MSNTVKYKQTGLPWCPEIPEDWELKKLKFYLKFTTGFTPPTKNENFFNGFNTWVTISDMKGKYISDSSIKISDEAVEIHNGTLVEKGSLLFSFKLSVGKAAFAASDLYTNEAIISIPPTPKLNLRFFYYTLPFQLLQNANENIYGAKLLNQDLIKNAYLIIPPSQTQDIIASYLDQKTAEIDNLISKKQSLIECLKEERMAIINQAVTKGINPDVEMKETGIEWLGEIPAHWEVKKLKYVAKINPNQRDSLFNIDPETEVVFLPMEKVSESGNKTQDILKPIKELTTGYTYFEKNDIIVAKITPCFENGKAAFLADLISDFGFGSTEFHTIRNTPKVLSEFVFFNIKSERFMKIGEAFMTGAAGQKRVSTDFLKEFLIPLPPLTEQTQIVSYIEVHTNRIDTSISKIEQEIELIKEYRTALINEVVTGKKLLN